MTIPNPEHLLDQAEHLIRMRGAPRQVSLRRAISGAYYGLFHFVLAAAADEFVGRSQRSSGRYALVYRSIDHRTLREICAEIGRYQAARKYLPYLPAGGFGADISAFAKWTAELQEKRHQADYNPQSYFEVQDTRLLVATARSAMRHFSRADPEPRKTFLTLLLFPPR